MQEVSAISPKIVSTRDCWERDRNRSSWAWAEGINGAQRMALERLFGVASDGIAAFWGTPFACLGIDDLLRPQARVACSTGVNH